MQDLFRDAPSCGRCVLRDCQRRRAEGMTRHLAEAAAGLGVATGGGATVIFRAGSASAKCRVAAMAMLGIGGSAPVTGDLLARPFAYLPR
ncbi:hypothetical protein [Paralimibaculum aggregatum]|uniref:hypothetical protein n=1 Tax=Paralimibaculum aggregatum TaxID=3036245 RepID=UPI002555082B|nr:hypothetical protein [Limibaculum sp. NKW23]